MLRPDTEKLWAFLKDQEPLKGFALVGGTALSMHLDHRLSEDLDFMFAGNKLPTAQINVLKRISSQAGFGFVADDALKDLQDWEDTGYEPHDYQQNFIVGGAVKVSLFAPDQEVLRLMDPMLEHDRVRVATLSEIFRTKCLVCADRSKTRDWFDVYTMLTHGSFFPMDIYDAFSRAQVPSKFDIARARMTHGSPGLNDEGFASLLSNPPSLIEMQSYFRGVFDEIETEVARRTSQTMRSASIERNRL